MAIVYATCRGNIIVSKRISRLKFEGLGYAGYAHEIDDDMENETVHARELLNPDGSKGLRTIS